MQKRSTVLGIILVCLCVILLVENIILQAKNRSLAQEVNFKESALQSKPGDLVPALRGRDLRGTSLTVAFPHDRDELLLIFSRNCDYCTQNWPNWESLLSRQLPADPILIDLSSSAGSSYLAMHHVESLPLIHEVDPAMIQAYKFRMTPQTIIVGANHAVKGVWTGGLTSTDLRQISNTITADAKQSRH